MDNRGDDLLAELPLSLKILLLVTRTRHEACLAEAMQRAVDGRHVDVRTKFLLGDPLHALLRSTHTLSAGVGPALSRAFSRSAMTPLIIERSPPVLRAAIASIPRSR